LVLLEELELLLLLPLLFIKGAMLAMFDELIWESAALEDSSFAQTAENDIKTKINTDKSTICHFIFISPF
jgi:hypothetical protein